MRWGRAEQRLLLAGLTLLLGACAGVERRGAPHVYAQALDSETNACIRFPSSCPEVMSEQAKALAARQRFAEAGARAASVAAGLRDLSAEQRARIDEAILDCVKDADFQVNEQHFGGSPTREQCAEVLERDARGNPVTRAMRLGVEKHARALECIQEKLDALRRGGFSFNQRYRLNKQTGKWEPLSREQVAALLNAGGQGLVGTIEPDIVMHTGKPAEVLDVYDLKFPCPGTNFANWNTYPKGHPYQGVNQGQLYEQAFGANPARVSPRWSVQRHRPPP